MQWCERRENSKQETERLANDAASREAMRAQAAAAERDEAAREAEKPGAWKWAIRKRIWDRLEKEDLAREPRPVHHRIPNFVGAELTASRVAALPEFQKAQVVKVNPDTPQKPIRVLCLQSHKILLVPQPRLRTGFFSKLLHMEIPPQKVPYAATSEGVKEYGHPLAIDMKEKVDLVVVGSVAVNPANGCRILS